MAQPVNSTATAPPLSSASRLAFSEAGHSVISGLPCESAYWQAAGPPFRPGIDWPRAIDCGGGGRGAAVRAPGPGPYPYGMRQPADERATAARRIRERSWVILAGPV